MGSDEPSREDFSTWRTLPTRWGDEDVYGHINNVVYYAYFDTAVNGWLMDALGTDIRDLPALGVVAETGCRFLRQLRFPDVVEAGIGVERLGRSSITYRIGLFAAGTAEAAAVGRFVHVYVDRESRAVVPVPDQVRAALEALG
ncbi:MAG: acyl-CoA thioesterase [Nocardioidaceae bacterium]|nr:acyl-CoA thioesterase [Nocardioidaceae bacterium]